MKHVITIQTNSSARELLRAIGAAVAILAKRFGSLTVRALKVARHWLITPRNYLAYDGEPIRATGLQVIGAQVFMILWTLLLSIRW